MTPSPPQQAPSQAPDSERANRFKATTFEDFASGGAPVWMKMLAGAVATPLVVVMGAIKSRRRNEGLELPSDPATIALVLAAFAIVGACLGAALTLKDVVQQRMAAGERVAFPLKLMFGYGLVSLLLWVPLVIVVTLVVTLVALS